jgi:hypothetical protein
MRGDIMTRRQALRSSGLALAVVCTAACIPTMAAQEEAAGRFDRTLTVSGPVDLSIKSGSGRIIVHPGSDGRVQIAAEIRVSNRWRADDEVMERVREIEKNPPIEQQGAVIRVGELPERLSRNISVSYTVSVPVATKLVSATGSGSQEIGSIRGPVNANTGSGSIEVGTIQDEVDIKSGSGSLTISGAKGRAEASSGSGSIHMRGVAGAARAHTGSGSIEIEQTAAGSVQVSSGSGSIHVNGVRGGVTASAGSGSIDVNGTPTEAWTIDAASGSVHLGLPSDAAFTLNAQTNSGDIQIDHPLTVTRLRRGRELHGKSKGGGPLVTVESSSGGISIGGH